MVQTPLYLCAWLSRYHLDSWQNGKVARRSKRPQYAFLCFHANGVLGTARLYFWLSGHAPSCGRLCFRSASDMFQRSQLPPRCRLPKPWIKAAPVWDLLNLKSSKTTPECLITFALKAMQSDALAAHSGHLEWQAWPPYLVSIIPDRIQRLNLDLHHFFTPLASQSQILPPAAGRFNKVQTQATAAWIEDEIKTKKKTDSSLCTV